MARWLVKAAVQGVLSQLPDPQRWNRLFQRYVTRSLGLTDELFRLKLKRCASHWSHWAERNGAPPRALELGTGWHPVVPVGLALLGAREVITIDQTALSDREAVLATMRRFQALADGDWLPIPAASRARLDAAIAAGDGDADALLARLSIRSLVGDARQLSLPSSSVDLFVSNNTFEHIPEEVLVEILHEFRRLASPDALGSHWIDMGDHYSVFDRRINQYHFLRYPGWLWRVFNNDLQYQNRLRIPDFIAIHERCGWTVVREEHSLGPIEELRKVRVARELRDRYSEDELRVHAAWVISAAA